MILEKFNKLNLEIQTEMLISLNSMNISIKMNIIQVVRLQEQVYNQIENYQIYEDKVRIFHKEDYLKIIIGKASIKIFKIQ
jgi:hypothetical protein